VASGSVEGDWRKFSLNRVQFQPDLSGIVS